MGAGDGHALPSFDRQGAQPLLVGHASGGIDLHQPLIGAQAGRAAPPGLPHLAAIEIGVAGMQQPLPIVAAYRDPGMAGS